MSVETPDWSKLPIPRDDGATRHLLGMSVPSIPLPATDGTSVDLSSLRGIVVVYTYPRTGRPGIESPPGWDLIPGARGCTERLHLPFPLLSDAHLTFTTGMRLPTFETSGMTLLKRVTLMVEDRMVEHVFHPVFPPERDASEVTAWLAARSERRSDHS